LLTMTCPPLLKRTSWLAYPGSVPKGISVRKHWEPMTERKRGRER
jgi:hypothetical protein